MSRLLRVIATLRHLEDALTTPVETHAFGAVLRCDAAPTLGLLNFVRIDAVGDDIGATVSEARAAAKEHGLKTIVLDDPSPTYNLAFEGSTSAGVWYRVPRSLYVCHEVTQTATVAVGRVLLDEFVAARRAFLDASGDYDTAEAGDEEAVARLLATAVETEHWGVRVDGALVSIGEINFSDDVAQLESLSTLPAYEGRGLATALIVARAQAAQERGAEIVFAQMRYDNKRSIKVHERVGFGRVGGCTTFALEPAGP